MQVKKFEASSVIEALQEVKNELGPDAIILSTQEAKRSIKGKRFVVVAAVSEQHLKKKELAQKQMGDVYANRVLQQPALKQKMFIENVYRGIEKKHEARNRKITQTRYIDIDGQAEETTQSVPTAQPIHEERPTTAKTRVQEAARAAFKSSLSSSLFNEEDNQERTSRAPAEPPQAVRDMVQRLKTCGVAPEIYKPLAQQVMRELGQESQKRAAVDAWFAKSVLNRIHIADKRGDEQVEIFIGPHGSGKTSALVKMATHYVVNEQKSVAIVTTDLNRVGAVEHLRVYSRILNAPVYVLKNSEELNDKLDRLGEYDKVLVDTPGISLSNMQELDFMRHFARLSSHKGHRTHLVISALTKEKDLGGVLKRFRVAEFDDVIVTNIDQTSQHGILLNIQEKVEQPFHSFGIGSDVVDGFEEATRERVLDLIFKLTKQIGERGNDSRI